MKSKQLPMMPVYTADWISSTRVLRPAERAVLFDLLCYQWQDGPLPVDPARLALLVGLPEAEFERVWREIRDRFEPTKDAAGLVNERLESEREKALELRTKASAKAATAAAARYAHAPSTAPSSPSSNAPSTATSSPQALLESCPLSLSPSPSPSLSASPPPYTEGEREREPCEQAVGSARNGFSQDDLIQKVIKLHAVGQKAGDIVKALSQYAVTIQQVRAWTRSAGEIR